MNQNEISRESSLETAFRKLVQEIEKEYRPLAKSLRIRIEKWLEKLVLTGSNTVWRKNRNAYARLLLDMVIHKRLTEPFHQLPPDGPLPSFPTHVQLQKGPNRDLLGPHESLFWRELYHKMDDVTEKSQYYQKGFHSEHPPFSMMDHAHFSREISNLNMVAKEQKIKIELLEQQLKEERARHELDIQRMHQVHRLELARILAKASHVTSYSPPTSPRKSTEAGHSFLSNASNHQNRGNVSSSSNTFSNDYLRFRPTPHETTKPLQKELSVHYSRDADIYPNSFNASQLDFAHSSEDEKKRNDSDILATSYLSTSHPHNYVTAKRVNHSRSFESFEQQQQQQQQQQEADIFPTRVSKDSLASARAVAHNPEDDIQLRPSHTPASSTDEEFLAYLDNFQSQLKEAQIETGLTVASIQDTLVSSTQVPASLSSPTAPELGASAFRQETSFDPNHPQFSDATLMSPARRSRESY